METNELLLRNTRTTDSPIVATACALLKLSLITTLGCFLSPYIIFAQESPTTPKPARVRITQGPELEMAREYLTIIRWTTNNPGGSPVHYGVVHYGLDPKNLSGTARSPIRLNSDHASTLFRVRLGDLKPGRTYYYAVSSIGADGAQDGTISGVRQFTTPAASQGGSR
jgi:hypothetical protein